MDGTTDPARRPPASAGLSVVARTPAGVDPGNQSGRGTDSPCAAAIAATSSHSSRWRTSPETPPCVARSFEVATRGART